MYYLNKKQKEGLGICGTILLSMILFFIIGNGNLNFGLYDDNQSQWLPVIDRAYHTFFETGKLPDIDFFQMKGMKIYDQGYYGLWNPFMMVAYLIRTYLLSGFDTNTISVYIIMMVLLGNLCCYGIFRKYGISILGSVLFSSCLMSVSVYVAISYWYYIYNVYFILSWLLLKMLKQREKESYYIYGAILSLSLFMGNVQYTVYMYLAYMCIMFVHFYRGDKKAAGKLVSNSICMGILSLVPLLLLLQASSRTLNFSGTNIEYYNGALHCLVFALFSWIPASFLDNMGIELEEFLCINLPLPDAGTFPGARSVYMGVMVCATIIFLFFRKKYKKDKLYDLAVACLASACFFLLMSFGQIGLFAIFAKQIPFLNSFRILAKYFVLVPILLVPCIAVVIKEQRYFWNRYTLLFILFFTFGIVHNRQLAFGTSQIKGDSSVKKLDELGVDYHNYRLLSFASLQEIEVFYPNWKDFAQRERISYEEKFSKNAGTTAGVMTLGGYDLAFDYKQFQMSDSIMGTVTGYGSEFGYDNMVIEEYFEEQYRKDSLGYWENLEKLRGQIVNNGVKYFIFTRGSSCYPVFLQLLEDMNLSVEWKKDFLEHTIVISINDVRPIVQGNDEKKIDAQVKMNKISFFSEEEQEFRVSMYYDKGLCACYINENGKKSALSIVPDTEGYVLISGLSDFGSGMVEVSYQNNMYLLGKIWNAIALMVILLMLFAPELRFIESAVHYGVRKIKVCLEYFAVIDSKKIAWICFGILLLLYIGFISFYYLYTDCTVPDEDWFLQIFHSIHWKADKSIFAYLAETENYLGYGQIYWILGGIYPNILFLRVMASFMLFGCLFFTLKEVKNRYGIQMVPYAGILWISMPYAWYTDKIIGPEILGLFLGIFGLYILNNEKYRWIGWCLLGISYAVKMNYIVFLLAAFLLEIKCPAANTAFHSLPVEIKQTWSRRITALAKGTAISLCGFILANPIILWDMRVYIDNMAMDSKIILEALSYVFERREREWDGVMVNGVFWGYVSAFLFIITIMWQIMRRKLQKTEKDCSFLQENYFYGNMAGMLSLLLVFVCCRDIFLGWYLLPLCYFMVIFICSRYHYGGKDIKIKNLNNLVFVFCLLLNGIILFPEHISNRENNLMYMDIAANFEKIQKETGSAKEIIEQEKPGIEWFYLLDFHMDEYTYNFEDYADFCVRNREGIAVIGKRMYLVPDIGEIVEKAINGDERLHILWQDKRVWIIERGV